MEWDAIASLTFKVPESVINTIKEMIKLFFMVTHLYA